MGDFRSYAAVLMVDETEDKSPGCSVAGAAAHLFLPVFANFSTSTNPPSTEPSTTDPSGNLPPVSNHLSTNIKFS